MTHGLDSGIPCPQSSLVLKIEQSRGESAIINTKSFESLRRDSTVAEKNVAKADAALPIDTTPIDPTIEAHLNSLSAGDLDRLADTYHPESVVILNKPLARITQAKHTANGLANIKTFLHP